MNLITIASMNATTIALIGCGAALGLLLIVILTMIVKRKSAQDKARYNAETEKIKVQDGVRYTVDKNTTLRNGELKVSHLEGDVILERGKEYTATRGGSLMPGKYTVLAAGEEPSFYLRVGGFVREHKHNGGIVLGEGDKICAVSHTVILR